jgi:hypothetical protein
VSEGVPPPPEGTEIAAPWAEDKKAENEEKNWRDDDKLKGQKKENLFRVLCHSGQLIVLFMWFFACVFAVSMGAWLVHFLTPAYWHWLTAEQLSKIQTVIFSGSLGAVVATYVQKHFS